MLLDWRNDAETRANSRQHEVVLWEAHLDWLAKILSDPARELLIAELDGIAVGTVRFDGVDGETLLSWTVAPTHRGKGLGRIMVQLATGRQPNRPLSAEIAVANVRSLAIARAAGFRLIRTIGDMTVWRRP